MQMETQIKRAPIGQKSFPAAVTLQAKPGSNIMDVMGATMSHGRNAEIYGEGEPTEYIYKLVSGAIRTYKILADGRRQIVAFYLPGEVFGLELGDEHGFSAEAVTPSKVLVTKRSTALALAARDTEIARQLRDVTGQELRRVTEHVLLLVKSARERLAGFLLEMAQRMSAPSSFNLPMSRQDIADYLGLTIETVSRAFTQLESEKVIALQGSRQISIANRAVLVRLNS